MKRLVSKLKKQSGQSCLQLISELAPLCFCQSFCYLGLSTVCCVFSATEAVQVNPGASFLERALGVSGFWSLQHGTSKNHRILEAQDSVSINIDPKQRTLKQYMADRCQVETVSITPRNTFIETNSSTLSLSGRNITIIIIELLHLDGLLVKSSKAWGNNRRCKFNCWHPQTAALAVNDFTFLGAAANVAQGCFCWRTGNRTCKMAHFQSATEWTASVHTLHMSKQVM